MGFLSSVASSAFDVAKDFGLSAYGDYRSRKAASAQRDWQEQMSNTAHEREVSDLRAAGLNPILSATGGNGASTPSGAMSTSDYRSKSSAFQNMLQTKLADNQIAKNKQEMRLMNAKQVTEHDTQRLLRSQYEYNLRSTAGLDLDNSAKAQELNAREHSRQIRRYTEPFKEIGSAFSSFLPSLKR